MKQTKKSTIVFQIGIINDAPHTDQNGMQQDGDLGGHAYSISSPTPSGSNGPDLTGLFVTSKTRSDRRSPDNNNETKGDLPPSYSAVEVRLGCFCDKMIRLGDNSMKIIA